ncbi:1091_t:CDS:2, partial [Acaulospora colombiana]
MAEVDDRLSHLRALLQSLPDSLPEWIGLDFRTFAPDNEAVEDYGPVGAVNRELEVCFGYASRSSEDGLVKIEGRGDALTAVVDVLIKAKETDPKEAAIVDKWVEDLIRAAEHAVGQVSSLHVQELDAEIVLLCIEQQSTSINHKKTQSKASLKPMQNLSSLMGMRQMVKSSAVIASQGKAVGDAQVMAALIIVLARSKSPDEAIQKEARDAMSLDAASEKLKTMEKQPSVLAMVAKQGATKQSLNAQHLVVLM